MRFTLDMPRAHWHSSQERRQKKRQDSTPQSDDPLAPTCSELEEYVNQFRNLYPCELG